LQSEFGIGVTETYQDKGHIDTLELYDLTAIVGIGGPINLLAAFSFEQSLIDAIYLRITEEIDVPAGEEDIYREAAAAEIVNTIIGNCTADIELRVQDISLTPPIILDKAKQIQRTKDEMFFSQRLRTRAGRMTINLVGPIDLLDNGNNFPRTSLK